MEAIIKFQDEKIKGNVTNLIPVHINTCRCSKYFWNWNKDLGDWVRGSKIPENLIRAYNNPKP